MSCVLSLRVYFIPSRAIVSEVPASCFFQHDARVRVAACLENERKVESSTYQEASSIAHMFTCVT